MSRTLIHKLIISKLWVLFAVLLVMVGYYVVSMRVVEAPVMSSSEVKEEITSDFAEGAAIYEHYAARVDRVDVVFEQRDYIQYRLTTNGFVREGELNTERGFEDDEDATVYVLNWQRSEGEQMRYVRLTNEPNRIYILDSNQEIVSGSALTLDSN